MLLLFLTVSTCVTSDEEQDGFFSSSKPLNPWIDPGLTHNHTYNSAVRPNQCYFLPGRTTTTSSSSKSSSSTSIADDDSSNNDNCAPNETTGDPGIQCLYLRNPSAKSRACAVAGMAARSVRRLRLAFCSHHPIDSVLAELQQQPPSAGREQAAPLPVWHNSTACERDLDRVQDADEMAHRIYCEFEHSLSRYDCHNGYSVKWNCEDCKAAYKNWVCAMFIPFRRDGYHYPPCRDFCHLVEQQCPYFLPDTKLQYAGESAFICLDRDIPEEFNASAKLAPYPDLPHCYLPCHLGLGLRNLTAEGDRCHHLEPRPTPVLLHANGSSMTAISDFVNTTIASSSVPRAARPPGVTLVLLIVAIIQTVVGRTLLFPPFCLGLT